MVMSHKSLCNAAGYSLQAISSFQSDSLVYLTIQKPKETN